MREFRTAYGPKIKQQLVCNDPSRAKQSMKDECDINFIMAKYQKTGLVNHLSRFQGEYGDFPDLTLDFQEAMQALADASEMFETIPASIRKRFNNDPGEFLSFATDPQNQSELQRLGLAPKPLEAPSDNLPPADPPPVPAGD